MRPLISLVAFAFCLVAFAAFCGATVNDFDELKARFVETLNEYINKPGKVVRIDVGFNSVINSSKSLSGVAPAHYHFVGNNSTFICERPYAFIVNPHPLSTFTFENITFVKCPSIVLAEKKVKFNFCNFPCVDGSSLTFTGETYFSDCSFENSWMTIEFRLGGFYFERCVFRNLTADYCGIYFSPWKNEGNLFSLAPVLEFESCRFENIRSVADSFLGFSDMRHVFLKISNCVFNSVATEKGLLKMVYHPNSLDSAYEFVVTGSEFTNCSSVDSLFRIETAICRTSVSDCVFEDIKGGVFDISGSLIVERSVFDIFLNSTPSLHMFNFHQASQVVFDECVFRLTFFRPPFLFYDQVLIEPAPEIGPGFLFSLKNSRFTRLTQKLTPLFRINLNEDVMSLLLRNVTFDDFGSPQSILEIKFNDKQPEMSTFVLQDLVVRNGSFSDLFSFSKPAHLFMSNITVEGVKAYSFLDTKLVGSYPNTQDVFVDEVFFTNSTFIVGVFRLEGDTHIRNVHAHDISLRSSKVLHHLNGFCAIENLTFSDVVPRVESTVLFSGREGSLMYGRGVAVPDGFTLYAPADTDATIDPKAFFVLKNGSEYSVSCCFALPFDVDVVAVAPGSSLQINSSCESAYGVLMGPSVYSALSASWPYCAYDNGLAAIVGVELGRYPNSKIFLTTDMYLPNPVVLALPRGTTPPPPGTVLSRAEPAKNTLSRGYLLLPSALFTEHPANSGFGDGSMTVVLSDVLPGSSIDPYEIDLTVCSYVDYADALRGCSETVPFPTSKKPIILDLSANVSLWYSVIQPLSLTLTLTAVQPSVVYTVNMYRSSPSCLETFGMSVCNTPYPIPKEEILVDQAAGTLTFPFALTPEFHSYSLKICVTATDAANSSLSGTDCFMKGLVVEPDLSHPVYTLTNLSAPYAVYGMTFGQFIFFWDNPYTERLVAPFTLFRLSYNHESTVFYNLMEQRELARHIDISFSQFTPLHFAANLTLPEAVVADPNPLKTVNISVSYDYGLSWSANFTVAHVSFTQQPETGKARGVFSASPTLPAQIKSVITLHGEGMLMEGQTPTCYYRYADSDTPVTGIYYQKLIAPSSYNDTEVVCKGIYGANVDDNQFWVTVAPNGLVPYDFFYVFTTGRPRITRVIEKGVSAPSTALNIFGKNFYNNSLFVCAFIQLDESTFYPIDESNKIYGTAYFFISTYIRCVTNPSIKPGVYGVLVSNNNEEFSYPPYPVPDAAGIIRFTNAPSRLDCIFPTDGLVVLDRYFSLSCVVKSSADETVLQKFHLSFTASYTASDGLRHTVPLLESSMDGEGHFPDLLLDSSLYASGVNPNSTSTTISVQVLNYEGIAAAESMAMRFIDCAAVRAHSHVLDRRCQCAAGYSAQDPTNSSTPCVPCAAGLYKNATGDEPCGMCSSATLAPAARSGARYCVCADTMIPRRAHPATGELLECTCDVGHTQDAQGFCAPCPFNTYKPVTGTATCTSCPDYFRTLEMGSTSPDACVCVSGFLPLTNTTTGALEECVCPPGHAIANTITMQCAPCKVGTFRSNLHVPVCEACPNPTLTALTGAASRLSCLCESGYYRLEAEADCTVCPPCGNCSNGRLPFPATGCFASNATTLSYVSCPVEGACLGGLNNTCGEGYEGSLCGTCSDGFYRGNSGQCIQCGENSAYQLPAMLTVFAVVLVFFYCLNYRPIAQDQLGAMRIGVNFLQITALYSEFNVNWVSPLKEVLKWAGLMNLDFDVAAPECSLNFKISFVTRLYFMLLLPVLVALVFFVIFLLNMFVSKLRSSHKPPADLPPAAGFTSSFVQWWRDVKYPPQNCRAFHSRTFIRSFLMSLMFLYVPMTKMVLEFFNCSSGVVVTEPSLECWGSTYMTHLPVAVVGLLVIVAGFPLFMFALTWKFKTSAANSLAVFDILSFLCFRYEPKYFFYETVVQIRKLSVVLALTLFHYHASFQTFVALFFLYLAIVVQSSCLPYVRAELNRLDTLSLTINVLTLLVGNVYVTQDSGSIQTLLSVAVVIVIGINIFFVGMVLYIESRAMHAQGKLSIFQRRSGGKKGKKSLSRNSPSEGTETPAAKEEEEEVFYDLTDPMDSNALGGDHFFPSTVVGESGVDVAEDGFANFDPSISPESSVFFAQSDPAPAQYGSF
eukprot:GCRY01002960.1.p1 GENE.GCRY01002960.1~~GCRY01002960.1.p1  ORF type:complete len:2140 (+),score=466.75 GCRY01002960.1:125-6544(+)